jgi:hypothetical protein
MLLTILLKQVLSSLSLTFPFSKRCRLSVNKSGNGLSMRWLMITSIALMIYSMFSQVPANAQVESSPWTGTWETNWRGGGAILRLEQSGTRVTGTYPLYEGSIEGTAKGQKLYGHWSRIGGRGEFIFVLSPDSTMESGGPARVFQTKRTTRRKLPF